MYNSFYIKQNYEIGSQTCTCLFPSLQFADSGEKSKLNYLKNSQGYYLKNY